MMGKEKVLIWNKRFLYFMAFTISALLMVGPFLRGLFFERELLPVKVLIFFLFLLFCIGKGIEEEDSVFFHSPLHICIFFVVLFYAISIPGAVHIRAAVGEFLTVYMYFFVFLLFYELGGEKRHSSLILYVLLFSTMIVAVGGLGAAVGSWEIHGAFVDGRLESPLQYANTSGAYFMAGLFLALGLSLECRRRYIRPVLLVFSSFLCLAIFFTYSRGVWLFMPFLILLLLILTPSRERVRLFFYLFTVTASSCFFLFPLALSLEAGLSTLFWVNLLLAGSLTLAGGVAIEYIELLKPRRRAFSYMLLLLLVLASGAYCISRERNALSPDQSSPGAGTESTWRRILPESIEYGVFSRGESVALRFAHYRDALKIIGDYPLLGAGGGGWSALYTSYQDQFYVARKVHNHFLQVWVEAGMFALVAFCGSWVFFTLSFFRSFLSQETPAEKKRRITLFIPVLAIVLHSSLDFTLSYGVVNLFLYSLLGMGASVFRESQNPAFSFFKLPFSGRGKWFLLASVNALLFFSLWSLYSSSMLTQQGLHYYNQREYLEAASYFKRSIQRDYLQASNYFYLARTYESLASLKGDIQVSILRDDAREMVARAYALEPFNPVFTLQYGVILFRQGFTDEGLSLLERLLQINPYGEEYYVYVASARLALLEQLLAEGDEAKGERAVLLLGSIFELENTMGVYFPDTAVLHFYLGQAAFLSHDLERGRDYFLQVKEADPNYRHAQLYLERIDEMGR